MRGLWREGIDTGSEMAACWQLRLVLLRGVCLVIMAYARGLAASDLIMAYARGLAASELGLLCPWTCGQTQRQAWPACRARRLPWLAGRARPAWSRRLRQAGEGGPPARGARDRLLAVHGAAVCRRGGGPAREEARSSGRRLGGLTWWRGARGAGRGARWGRCSRASGPRCPSPAPARCARPGLLARALPAGVCLGLGPLAGCMVQGPAWTLPQATARW